MFYKTKNANLLQFFIFTNCNLRLRIMADKTDKFNENLESLLNLSNTPVIINLMHNKIIINNRFIILTIRKILSWAITEKQFFPWISLFIGIFQIFYLKAEKTKLQSKVFLNRYLRSLCFWKFVIVFNINLLRKFVLLGFKV